MERLKRLAERLRGPEGKDGAEAGRPRRGSGGFTLIELMVVLLIIGILMVIAIPIYLSERNKANHTAAETTVRNAIVALDAVYSGQNYYGVPASSSATDLAAYMATQEPAITWEEGTAVQKINEVSITTSDSLSGTPGTNDQGVVVTAWSPDGKCFSALVLQYAYGSVQPGTYYNVAMGSSTGCTAPALASPPTVITDPTNSTAGNSSDWYPSWSWAA